MKRKSTDYVCFLKGLFADLGGLLVSFSLLVLVESFRRLNRKNSVILNEVKDLNA